MPRPEFYPRWATELLTDPVRLSLNRIKPTPEKQIRGFNPLESPARNTVNWLFWCIDEWIEYFDTEIDTRIPVSGDFVPEYIGATSGGVGTYVFNEGSYQIVGEYVMVNVYTQQTSHTGTGQMLVSLPLPASADYQGFKGGGSRTVTPSGVTDLCLVGVGSGQSAVTFTANGAAVPLNIEPGTCYHSYYIYYKYQP